IIFNEHDAAAKWLRLRGADDIADELLAAPVLRVRLAGEHKLHRTAGLRQNAQEPLGIAEEQGGPLVGGKPPRKADREGPRVEKALDFRRIGRLAAQLARRQSSDPSEIE